MEKFKKSKETDYTNRCGNCHSYMDTTDRYCKYCGTERGQGAFLPFENIMACVYAPPIQTNYVCNVCGYHWTVQRFGWDSSKYCPQCRADNIQYTREEIPW